jgi:hypothetical protein
MISSPSPSSEVKVNWKKVYQVKAGGIFVEYSTAIPHNSTINPLIIIPSPRDIQSVKDAIDKCLKKYDKVWFKYWTQKAQPYKYIKQYFLKRTQYTHLVLLPDDLIINQEGVDRLFSTVSKEPDKYKVLMGDCPISYTDKTYCSFTKNLPALEHSRRYYDWVKIEEVKGKGIIQVIHSGTPFAIFKRNVVEKLSFDSDYKWNLGNTYGSSEDVVISNELTNMLVPIYVDTDARFIHLKDSQEAIV